MAGRQRWHKFDVETSRIMNCRSEPWDLSSGRRGDRKYWGGAVWTGKQLTVGHYKSRSEGEKNQSPEILARLWQVPDVVLIKRSAAALTDEKGSRLKGGIRGRGIRRTWEGGGRGSERWAESHQPHCWMRELSGAGVGWGVHFNAYRCSWGKKSPCGKFYININGMCLTVHLGKSP